MTQCDGRPEIQEDRFGKAKTLAVTGWTISDWVMIQILFWGRSRAAMFHHGRQRSLWETASSLPVLALYFCNEALLATEPLRT
jgi:hypothetical protein